MTKSFRILALDGGGIHGAATAAYLTHIEGQVDTPIRRFFDLIVGTSTGGLIGLALARDIPAEEVLDLYLNRGPQLFQRRLALLPKSMVSAFGPIYRSEPLHEELQRILGEDTRLGDAKCRVCVPAVNITSGRAVVFKTRHHEDFERDFRLRMWRVAAATAAAPIYFRPVEIPEAGWFVDGGLWSNTPTTVGVAEGIKLGYRLSEIHVLSVGTGLQALHVEGASHRLWGHLRHGLIGWGRSLVGLTMHVQSQRANNLSRYLLPREQFMRVNFPLPPEAGGLDAVHQVEMFAQRARACAKAEARDVRRRFFSEEALPFAPLPLPVDGRISSPDIPG